MKLKILENRIVGHVHCALGSDCTCRDNFATCPNFQELIVATKYNPQKVVEGLVNNFDNFGLTITEMQTGPNPTGRGKQWREISFGIDNQDA